MLHTSVTVLTLVSTLLHAVLGCCAHHGHVHAAEAVSKPAVAAVRHSCCSHCKSRVAKDAQKHSQQPSGRSDEHDGHDHSSCDEPSCQLLTTPKVQIPASDWLVSQDRLPADSVFAADLARLTASGPRNLDLPDSGRPPGISAREMTHVWLL